MATKRQRREWLLKVALVELGLWVSRGDGEVSRHEATLILRLLRDWGATAAELALLEQLGRRRIASHEPPREALAGLPTLLDDEQRPVFVETLAEVAFTGQPRCPGKVGRLLDVCRALGLAQYRGLKLIEEVTRRLAAAGPGAHDGGGGGKGSRGIPEQPTMLLPCPDALRPALAVLGLERPDEAAARRAYRRLTLLYHPDRHPEADAERREQLLRQLLRVRRAYQLVLRAAAASAPARAVAR